MTWAFVALGACFVVVVVFWYKTTRRTEKLAVCCARLKVVLLEVNEINNKSGKLIFEYMVKTGALVEVLGRCTVIAKLDPMLVRKEIDSVTDRIRGEETIKEGFSGPEPEADDQAIRSG